MKNIIMMVAGLLFLVVGTVSAGVGINQDDLNAINPNMENRPTITTQIFAAEQYGLLEVTPEEFSTLKTDVISRPAEKNEMVDIGTGRMTKEEFNSLTCAVGSTNC